MLPTVCTCSCRFFERQILTPSIEIQGTDGSVRVGTI
jgi:hypothetical protein